MRYTIDTAYLLDSFRRIVETPSPVGYSRELNPVLEALAAELGHSITYDNRGTPYITLEGEDNSHTVLVGAHADTLGLIVRRIDTNGMIRIRGLGGVNLCSLEGETVTVHTRDGRAYTGLFTCQSHSVHVFDDAKTLERSEKTMMIILDEKVSSRAEVEALGIRHGDHISIDPRCQITPNGYIKSRFIDDKAAVACCYAALKYLGEQGLKPKYRTLFAFPYAEELGLGGTYVPPEVEEYVAVDIGLIGPDYDGDEYKVSICAKDAAAPYNYDLTTRLIDYAEKAGCDYAVDIYYRYGTDAHAAVRAGNNLRAATFGMAVWCSHGMERTHITGLENTVNLLLAYLLDL
ncbi:MAG: M20/M25/M40 family metallo-hydrolase [Clostridia bacterium]|nr:M20/M25/M40 family metallo-hydrolase [Clostridia bacterium]